MTISQAEKIDAEKEECTTVGGATPVPGSATTPARISHNRWKGVQRRATERKKEMETVKERGDCEERKRERDVYKKEKRDPHSRNSAKLSRARASCDDDDDGEHYYTPSAK